MPQPCGSVLLGARDYRILGQLLHEGVLGADDAHAEGDGVQGGDGPREGEHVGVEGPHRGGGRG